MLELCRWRLREGGMQELREEWDIKMSYYLVRDQEMLESTISEASI